MILGTLLYLGKFFPDIPLVFDILIIRYLVKLNDLLENNLKLALVNLIL